MIDRRNGSIPVIRQAMNHTPFCGSNDIMMVIVSRNFSTLLDHAITGLNTWSRRHVLCLQFDDSGEDPCLKVHIPKAWSAIGQKCLPASGLVTATLSFKPSPELDENDIYAIYSTAAGLMVREAERSGGSGFAIVAYNHFYPGLAEAPYLILAGAVNPFSFLELARDEGLLENSSSPISDYILEDERVGDLAVSWDWLSCDGGAAVEYLRGYGTPQSPRHPAPRLRPSRRGISQAQNPHHEPASVMKPDQNHPLKNTKSLHRYVFQDMYDWAGKIRTLDIAKPGSYFAHFPYIAKEARRIAGEFAEENNLRNLNKTPFVERLAYYYGEWNALHPFREGNGRSLRQFIFQLSHDAGYLFDQTEIDNIDNSKGQWNEAAAAGMSKDYGPVIDIFNRAIRSPS